METQQALKAGYSSRTLCIRPNQPITGITRVTRQGPARILPDATTTEPKLAQGHTLEASITRLEQQVRDSVLSRTTANVGEQRVLKNAFSQFDRDCSGLVDVSEFTRALEHLGLHTSQQGLPGEGGLELEVVEGLFMRYDADRSGSISYTEFIDGLLRENKITGSHKMA